MNGIKKDWPPLILSSQRPAWIRWRDAILTTAAWLLVTLMLLSQFRLLLGQYGQRLDVYPLFQSLGLSQPEVGLGLVKDLVRLAPFFLVVFLLLAFLSTFALHTLTRRRRALQETPPQPLPLATEARNAALGGLQGYAGAKTEALHARLDEATMGDVEGVARPIDARDLLVAMKGKDEAALADARSLQILDVHIDADGKYHIEDAKETPGKS
jgi:hypothetical protein